jgi:hypothetical protein
METTLNSRLVGVTAGLGTSSTESCTGSRNTAPDTPTGAVTTDTTTPAMKLSNTTVARLTPALSLATVRLAQIPSPNAAPLVPRADRRIEIDDLRVLHGDWVIAVA